MRSPASPRGRAVRALARSRTGMIGGAIVIAFVVCALFAPWLAPYPPHEQIDADARQGLSTRHWLGTTTLGEDVASQLLYGARTSLVVGVVSVAISLAIGTMIGLVAGYAGGWTDTLAMRAVDVLLAFPSVLLAIAVIMMLGRSLTSIMIATGVVGIPLFARQTRAGVLATIRREFVEASRALGAGHARLLFIHILPHCASTLVVLATLRIATAVLESAGLAFLGLGGSNVLEWGMMLADNQNHYRQLPHTVIAPGVAISATVLGFNLFGDALRDALDPRLN